MNPSIPPLIQPRPRDRVERFFRWMAVVLMVCVALLALAAYGVTGYFRLSPEMAGLRDGLQSASGQPWQRKIAVNVGRPTFFAVRNGLSLVHMQDEARVALQTIRACEVGIYETSAGTDPEKRAALLTAADAAMSKRGWERIVGVMDGENLVAVFVPASLKSTDDFKCCVMVMEGHKMILASTRANLDAAIKLAMARADFGPMRGALARK